jgi:hypothetical protein
VQADAATGRGHDLRDAAPHLPCADHKYMSEAHGAEAIPA